MRCEDVQGRPKRSMSFNVDFFTLNETNLVTVRVVGQTFN